MSLNRLGNACCLKMKNARTGEDTSTSISPALSAPRTDSNSLLYASENSPISSKSGDPYVSADAIEITHKSKSD